MSTAERQGTASGLTAEQEKQDAAERAALLARIAALPPAPPPPKRMTDSSGRLLPISQEEREARAKAILELFEEFKKMPNDDPPGAYEAALVVSTRSDAVWG